ncbi:MAG: hypothetical protein ABI666_06750 [Ferruginibacter sp.]
MKTSINFILLILLCTLFSACQKQLDFETTGTKSVGNLAKDISGNCSPVTVNGIYKVASQLNSSHYIDVSVNVSSAGSYVITTDTISGIYFRNEGQFTTTGTQTVRLAGNGKPVSAGILSFIVHYNDSTSCAIQVTVSPAGGGPLATFTLAGAPGSCTTPGIQGTYTAGTVLDASNKLVISVDVSAIGDYTLSTTIVNGIGFTASGTFTVTGPQTVTLSGNGTPLNAGATTMSVSGTVASCSFSITINPAGGGGTANFVFAGGGGDCAAGSGFSGKYIKGTAFTAYEMMTVDVFVATGGTYTIYTDTVNGVYFRKTGTFAATGAQSVAVPGFGTPLNTGSFYFEMNKNNGTTSSCTSYKCFFGDGAIAAAGDYFPITANSWWSYNSTAVAAPDSLYKKAETNSTIASNTYRRFYIGLQPVVTPYDSTFFRKSGQDVLEYVRVDTFIGQVMTVPQFSDLVLLKQDVQAGTTWQSPIFSGTNGLGQPLKIVYRFQIETVGGTLVVNGKTYTDVIKVVWGGYSNVNNFGGYPQSFAAESYYAKGVGLIKFQSYPGYPNTSWSYTEDLRNYQVF